MAGDLLGTYDPASVTLNFSGVNVSGFMDGTFITCARDDNEVYKKHVGAWGEVGRTKNNNIAGTITFTLKKTSPSNAVLDKLKLVGVSAPAMVRNNSDSVHIAVSSSAWIQNEPDINHSVDEDGIEWQIGCADLVMSHL